MFLLKARTEIGIPVADKQYKKEQAQKEGHQEGIREGIKEGIRRGIKQEKIDIAKNMLKENISVDVIAKVAKITVEQVIAIGKKTAVL